MGNTERITTHLGWGVILAAFELGGAALWAGNGGRWAETEGKGERENQAPCGVAGVLGVVGVESNKGYSLVVLSPQVSPTWTFLFLNLYTVHRIYSYYYPPTPIFLLPVTGGGCGWSISIKRRLFFLILYFLSLTYCNS